MKQSDLSSTDLPDCPTAEGRPLPLPERSEGPSTDAVISGEVPLQQLSFPASGVEAQAVREIMGTKVECEFDEMNIAVTILCLQRLSLEIGDLPTQVKIAGDSGSYAAWRSAAISHLRRKEAEKFSESTISIR